MSLLTENIAEFCRQHPLDEKIIVVPNRIVGRQITDAVARALAPGGWVNLRAETVASLAHEVIGTELATESRRRLSRAQVLAIVEKICAETLDDDSYFGHIRSSSGFHRALAGTLVEIRAAGLDPASLSKVTLESGEKTADLGRLLAAYEEELAATFIDGPGILRRAITRLQTEPTRGAAWTLVPSRPRIDSSDAEFLKLFAGDRMTAVDTDHAPKEWRDSKVEIDLVRALGEGNELREAFREVVSGIPCDQVEILYTDRATYLPLAYELTEELQLPATFVDRIAATYTRPGRALISFLDWLSSDFEEIHLRRMLSDGVLDIAKLADTDELGSLTAARVIRSARIGWGRDRHLAGLDAFAARQSLPSDRADHDEDSADRESLKDNIRRIGEVRKLVARLIEVAPTQAPSAMISVRDLAASCQLFLKQCVRSASELDGVALAAIPPVLDDLGFLESGPVEFGEAAARVREAVAELYVGGSRVTYPQPGSIHFAGFEDGGYTGRPHTFLVGLDESRHPGAGLQDPILLDHERDKLNGGSSRGALTRRSEVPGEKTAELKACLARLRGKVTLSYSSRDLSEDREIFPAAILREIFPPEILPSESAPAGFIPATTPLDLSEWCLARFRETGRPEVCAPAVWHAYPWLQSGRMAREARRNSQLTVFDGWIPSAGTELDPRMNGETMSATRLEKLAECPFAYFLRYVLNVRPPDDIERDEGNWLNSAGLGVLLHELFRDFMREITARGLKPSLERDAAQLRQLAEVAVARWRSIIPPPNLAAFERQVAQIGLACEIFLRSEEIAAPTRTPVHFEYPFGGTAEAGAIEISVRDGMVLRFRGSIDRIDRASDGTFEVWDYKTGRGTRFDAAMGLDGGRRLQHGVYAAAFEARLRQDREPVRVSQAGYLFVGPHGSGRRDDFGFEMAHLVHTLDLICDVARNAAFVHTDDEKGCPSCPYEEICGKQVGVVESAERKLEDDDNDLLLPLKALKGTDS